MKLILPCLLSISFLNFTVPTLDMFQFVRNVAYDYTENRYTDRVAVNEIFQTFSQDDLENFLRVAMTNPILLTLQGMQEAFRDNFSLHITYDGLHTINITAAGLDDVNYQEFVTRVGSYMVISRLPSSESRGVMVYDRHARISPAVSQNLLIPLLSRIDLSHQSHERASTPFPNLEPQEFDGVPYVLLSDLYSRNG